MRKVVELARALCTEPKLLLLDEPSSGLNVEETEDMAFWIQDIQNDLGITVLMVEHDMTLVSKVSDRVLAMNQGEVLAMGTPREVQNHPGVIEAYLGSVDDVSSLQEGNGMSQSPPAVSDTPVLKLLNVESAYGPIKAIRGVSLQVRRGEIATVLGSNGAGKTTILKTISGIIDPRKGSIEFKGEDITARDPAYIVQQGLSHVPEGREVFPLLSVHDNLLMGAYTRKDRDGVARDMEAVYRYFPILQERAAQDAGLLSGGQQQMLAISRAHHGRARPDPAGRAQPGPVAQAHPRDLRDRGAHQPRARQHHPAGGAERQHGAQRLRLRLRAGERPHRDGRHLRPPAREGRHQGVLPGHEGSRRARRAALEEEEELAMNIGNEVASVGAYD